MDSVPLTAEPLWRPHPDQIRDNLARFAEWLREKRSLDLRDHRALYDWSVRDLEGFWSAIAEFYDVRFYTPAERVPGVTAIPFAQNGFPAGRLIMVNTCFDSVQVKLTIRTTGRRSCSVSNRELLATVGF